jgi:uncharacterized protein (TIGR03083 family)
MSHLSYERYHAELAAETARLAEIVRATEPARAVPTCPEWTLAQLAEHVGRGHRWAATIVERRATQPLPQDSTDGDPPPHGRAELAGWLVTGAGRLSAAVHDAGPAAPVWTWAPERTAGFWLRRITHDTVIHRLDAALATGAEPELEPDLAADGVSDLLSCIETLSTKDHPDPVFAGLRGTGQTLHLHATDAGLGAAGEWFIERTPDGVRWEHGHRKGDVAARGRAADLLLVLNRRTTRGVDVIGDEQLFTHWLGHSAF